MSPEELHYLFLHELTHIRRHDLWVRFFAMLAVALHWYDPLVYVLNKQIKDLSEQSCDERVSAPLDRDGRFAYGSVLLKLAADTVAGPWEWAVSLSAKDTIERRLIRVLHSEKLKGPEAAAGPGAGGGHPGLRHGGGTGRQKPAGSAGGRDSPTEYPE